MVNAATTQMALEAAITSRIARFANALSSATFAQSTAELAPVMTELDDLLGEACILERLVFTRSVLTTPGVPRIVIDRLLADNFLVARMLTQAGFDLDEERTIKLLETGDEAFKREIASHEGISQRITDYLIEIGDDEVAFRLASNKRAKLSASAIVALVDRAGSDLRILQALANRRDLAGDGAQGPGDSPPSNGLGARAEPEPKALRPIRRLHRGTRIINHR